jgi:hypothetical protein
MLVKKKDIKDTSIPFREFINEDKSGYKKAREVINPKTNRYYIDPDDSFLIGNSGGFLYNINFRFIDTHLFREMAIFYEQNGVYTFAEDGSPEHEELRQREEYRRENGMTAPCKLMPDGTIEDLHIPGSLYNFLNYGRMSILDWSSVHNLNDIPKKKEGFPRFFDFQYWKHKADQFAERNGFNQIILKARRKGMSYDEAIDSGNIVNLSRQLTIIHAAYDKKYLTEGRALTTMARDQLNFYESTTLFRRGATRIDKDGNDLGSTGLLKKDIDHMITGYKDLSNTDAGRQSRLLSVSTKISAAVATGKDGKRVKVDEVNMFPNLAEFMKETAPTLTTGAFKTGMIKCIGTGGVKESDMFAFIDYFTNPHRYDFMPFENVWDFNRRHEVCGMYIPFVWGLEGIDENGDVAVDDDGNTDFEIAARIYIHERWYKLNNPDINESYEDYISKHSNNPEESLTYTSDSIFASKESRSFQEQLVSDSTLKFYTDGDIIEDKNADYGHIFRSNEWLKSNGYTTHPYIEKVPFSIKDDIQGCIRLYHSPFRDRETGLIPDNLYFVTYDPIAVEKELKDVTNQNSLASMKVWMYPNTVHPSGGKMLVAAFAGRRESSLELDRIAIRLCKLYNAKILPEMDRGDVLSNFKKEGELGLILPDPADVISGSKKRSYGMIIGSGQRKGDCINKTKDFLHEKLSVDINGRPIRRFEYIPDLPTIREMNLYNPVKGNFDRISDLMLAVEQFECFTFTGKTTKSADPNKKRLADKFKVKKR